jgi:anaerobic magnesium-protoporphyrin IX monomethyl ester cyclase
MDYLDASKIKILLAYPPKSLKEGWDGFLPFPENIACLGSFVKEKNADVKIYHDHPYKASSIMDIIRDQKPHIFGMSCDSANFDTCFLLAKWAKNIDKNVLVVLGGNHASFFHSMILEKIPWIDIVVRNEGELTLGEICECLIKNDRCPDFKNVKGMSYKAGQKIHSNPDRPFIDNLDTLPPMSYDLLDMVKIKLDSQQGAFLIHTGRGCCFRCQYCADKGIWKNIYRYKSPKKIIEEIEICKKKYKAEKIFFSEDTFTTNRQRITQLCQLLKDKKIKIKWGCNTRIDCVEKKLLIKMKSAGCTMIAYGAESLSDTVLKLMKKNYSAALACDVLNLTNKLKIDARFNLILGYPGETEKTLQETLTNIKKLDKNVFCKAVSFFQLHPGSPIYDLLRTKKIIDDSMWFSGYKINEFLSSKYPKFFIKIIKKYMHVIERNFDRQRRLRNYIDV